MKILGFAHLTIALPLNEFPSSFNCLETYQQLVNTSSKLKLMRHKDRLHDLQLIGGNLELTYYESSVPFDEENDIPNVIQNHLQNPKEIWIGNLNSPVLEFLNTLAPRSVFISKNSLRVKGVGTLNEITLTKSDSGLYFKEFLDECGPVALGFYVDKLELNLQEAFSKLPIKIQEPFEFRVGKNSFKILFVSVEGINIEFLQR